MASTSALLTSLQSAFTWSPYSPDRASSPSSSQQIKLPDLLAALPSATRDFRINSLCSLKVISEASEQWSRENIGLCPSNVKQIGIDSLEGCANNRDTDKDEENETLDLKTGLLASMCFPRADRTQLELCAFSLSWIWLLDYHLMSCSHDAARECADELIRLAENEPGSTEISRPGFSKGLQDILKRLERSPESKYIYDSFRSAILAYLQLLRLEFLRIDSQQSSKSYFACRREAGWHILLFILIEYAHGLEALAVEDQSVALLNSVRGEAAECIVYSLDIYAYAGSFLNSNPSRVSQHNCALLLVQEQNFSPQSAIDRAGELWADKLRAFSSLQEDLFRRQNTASIGSKKSAEIEIYVRALGDCIRGILHWAFESERFFGKNGAYVRIALAVEATIVGNVTQEEEVEE